MSNTVLWIIALPLYGLAMCLSGRNDGYYKGYNEALKEINKELEEYYNDKTFL